MSKNMRKLIAIGGGEIGRPGFPIETTAIDKEIIKQSGKKHPKLLFIPTASRDAANYIETVNKYFGGKLGCKTDTLLTVREKPGFKTLRDKILGADIIYVGGGNTLYMMTIWRKLKIDKLLRQAYEKGTVMSGLSAGSICWFKYGNSDSRKFSNPASKNFIRVKGMSWFKLTMSPHHIREKERKTELLRLIKKHGGIGLALDDYAALEILDDKFRIISSKPIAQAYKVYFNNKKFSYIKIPKNKFLPISVLTEKLYHNF